MKFNLIFAVDYFAYCLSNVVISGTFELGDLYHFFVKSSSSHSNSARSLIVCVNASYEKNINNLYQN